MTATIHFLTRKLEKRQPVGAQLTAANTNASSSHAASRQLYFPTRDAKIGYNKPGLLRGFQTLLFLPLVGQAGRGGIPLSLMPFTTRAAVPSRFSLSYHPTRLSPSLMSLRLLYGGSNCRRGVSGMRLGGPLASDVTLIIIWFKWSRGACDAWVGIVVCS